MFHVFNEFFFTWNEVRLKVHACLFAKIEWIGRSQKIRSQPDRGTVKQERYVIFERSLAAAKSCDVGDCCAPNLMTSRQVRHFGHARRTTSSIFLVDFLRANIMSTSVSDRTDRSRETGEQWSIGFCVLFAVVYASNHSHHSRPQTCVKCFCSLAKTLFYYIRLRYADAPFTIPFSAIRVYFCVRLLT